CNKERGTTAAALSHESQQIVGPARRPSMAQARTRRIPRVVVLHGSTRRATPT
ncbi:unnamed protein product, partial [Laminaria digitata]